MENSKVFVVALDGATPELIEPWAEAGHLPVLCRLIRGGTSGTLRSTYPPLTGPAWCSFMTGKSPGRHGILEFFHRRSGTYRQTLNSRLSIDGKSLWRLLGEARRHVGVIGIPLTYPPEPVNGFLITGLLTPDTARDFTDPPELLTELEDALGPYRLRHDEKYRRADPQPFISEQYEILEYRTRAALHLMQTKPWDFFMVHFYGSDRIQHEFWHLLDLQHPQHDPRERQRLGNVVLDLFKALDAAVGQLVDALDDDTVVIVMSDHGFGPIHKYINVNTWLLQQGLLQLKSTPGTRARFLLYHLGFNYAHLSRWVLKVGLGRRAKEIGRARREELQRKLFLSLDDVDWSRSRVFSMGNFGQLYINLRGRESQGIVEPGDEYEALLLDLTQRLRGLSDPETGHPVIERVFTRQEIYDGPYTDRAPDLMYLTRDMVYKAMGLSDFASPRIFEPVYGTTGHHRMDGIFIGYKPGVIAKAHRLDGARIYDLAPTILHLLEQPIPRSMDGCLLDTLFTPEYREAHPPRFTDADGPAPGSDQAGYTTEEEAKITEVLRALGYVT